MYATEYVADNWILILVLLGFTISLISTVFMEQKTIRRLYALIVEVFLLSIVVFAEFKMDGIAEYRGLRIVLMAIRYSATPLLVAQIVYTVAKGQKWYLFVPAGIFTALDFISIPTGIVFALDDANKLVRGPLGMLPYVGAGVYVYILYITSGSAIRVKGQIPFRSYSSRLLSHPGLYCPLSSVRNMRRSSVPLSRYQCSCTMSLRSYQSI